MSKMLFTHVAGMIISTPKLHPHGIHLYTPTLILLFLHSPVSLPPHPTLSFLSLPRFLKIELFSFLKSSKNPTHSTLPYSTSYSLLSSSISSYFSLTLFFSSPPLPSVLSFSFPLLSQSNFSPSWNSSHPSPLSSSLTSIPSFTLPLPLSLPLLPRTMTPKHPRLKSFPLKKQGKRHRRLES